MSQLEINNVLRCLEKNGHQEPALDCTVIHVSSHWNYNDRVVLEVEGVKVTVLAKDLKRAIDNATNHGF